MPKIILVTFGGREYTLKTLFKYILKYKSYISEYILFIATKKQSDIDYMLNFAKENSFVKTIYLEGSLDKTYKYCQEEDTVYIKLDDDIVYLEETLFTDFVKFRLENKEPLIIFPIIINNTFISSYLQQKKIFNFTPKSYIYEKWPNIFKKIKTKILNNDYNSICDLVKNNEVLCPYSWGNLNYCIKIHENFLNDIKNNNLDKYRIDDIILEYSEPVSINCCCWIGGNLKKVIEKIGDISGDEPWLTLFAPTKINKSNIIYGKTIVSHYAFYKQRELGLDKTDISEKYYKLI